MRKNPNIKSQMRWEFPYLTRNVFHYVQNPLSQCLSLEGTSLWCGNQFDQLMEWIEPLNLHLKDVWRINYCHCLSVVSHDSKFNCRFDLSRKNQGKAEGVGIVFRARTVIRWVGNSASAEPTTLVCWIAMTQRSNFWYSPNEEQIGHIGKSQFQDYGT